MKRSTIYLRCALGIAALYGIVWLILTGGDYLSLAASSPAGAMSIGIWYFRVAPWYALICLGCFCLARLGNDLLAYRDFPDAVQDLAEEISRTKHRLQQLGYKS